ncbi:hypothetical protein ACJIZ3_023911 [Penstemon smallii]|uniref:Reverse transcriptase domain-containing protein n=1 Tax=Penstemon smallii TaxID=265156 RepID=A0ABD3TSP6_9LAMI
MHLIHQRIYEKVNIDHLALHIRLIDCPSYAIHHEPRDGPIGQSRVKINGLIYYIINHMHTWAFTCNVHHLSELDLHVLQGNGPPCADFPFPTELKNLFPPIMEQEENENLCKLPTPREIKQVLFSFASDKSPGPDGLPALFYKHFWSTTGTALIQVVQHFFRTGYMLKTLNHTFVALIPKIPNASRVDQFRPISLCNISYKVISKILANRLKPLLKKIISPNQMAFVEGRTINENTIISHEIMHYMHNRRGKKGFCAIKIDLSKAYDRVEWNLLYCILKHIGICDKFINWVKQCISTCSFSFLINGAPFGLIRPSRGIRQGDPFSPYLFIIYTELLSRFLIKEENNGTFKGIKIARTCPTISHLLYADDLVIYCRANHEDVETIFTTLDKFSSWSGQIINHEKSFTHFSRNVDVTFKNDLTARFNLKECDHKSKHLGLPFCKPKSKSKAFNEIISKLQLKLNGWKCKNLSQAGRTILVKTVAQSLPIYPMSTFLLPKSICSTLDKIIRKFWWGSNDKGNSLMLKSWSTICLPKSKGGLEFRKTEDFNRALVTKLTWKVASNDNELWVEVLKGKYLQDTNLLDSDKDFKAASWVWKDIVSCKQEINFGACFSIHQNSSVHIWSKPWIPSLPGFIPTPIPNTLLSFNDFSTVSQLFCYSRVSWDVDILLNLFPSEVVLEIRKINISPPTSHEKLFWSPSKSGKFTSKSCYLSSQAKRFPTLNTTTASLFKNIWNTKLHNRLKFFCWKITSDILPTRKRLSSLFHIDQIFCPVCGSDEDSADHIFICCPFSIAVWFHSCWNFRMEPFQSFSATTFFALLFDKNSNLFISNKKREEFLTFAICAFDALWKNRNNIVHNSSPFVSVQDFTSRLQRMAKDHTKARISLKITSAAPTLSRRWSPPKKGFLAINSDAAFKDGLAATGFIIRNHFGSILFASSCLHNCLNPTVAEALAVKEACSFLNFLKIDNAIFESDYLNLVMAINNWESNLDWSIAGIVEEIKKKF